MCFIFGATVRYQCSQCGIVIVASGKYYPSIMLCSHDARTQAPCPRGLKILPNLNLKMTVPQINMCSMCEQNVRAAQNQVLLQRSSWSGTSGNSGGGGGALAQIETGGVVGSGGLGSSSSSSRQPFMTPGATDKLNLPGITTTMQNLARPNTGRGGRGNQRNWPRSLGDDDDDDNDTNNPSAAMDIENRNTIPSGMELAVLPDDSNLAQNLGMSAFDLAPVPEDWTKSPDELFEIADSPRFGG
jgi:hypothetical protein